MKKMRIIVTILYTAILFASSFHNHALSLGIPDNYKAAQEKVNVIFHVNNQCVLSQFRSNSSNYIPVTSFELQKISSGIFRIIDEIPDFKFIRTVDNSTRAPPVPA